MPSVNPHEAFRRASGLLPTMRHLSSPRLTGAGAEDPASWAAPSSSILRAPTALRIAMTQWLHTRRSGRPVVPRSLAKVGASWDS